MKIYRGDGVEMVDLEIDGGTTINNRLMVENTLTVRVDLAQAIDLRINDYVVISGERYELYDTPQVTISVDIYSYDALFVGNIHRLDNWLLDNSSDESYYYYATLTEHLEFIMRAIAAKDSGWSYTLNAQDVDASPKNIDYSSLSCLSSLHKLAEQYDIEFDVKLKNIAVAHKIERVSSFEFAVGRGEGLYKITRGKISNSKVTTRLYGLGSKINMTAGQRLVFDEKYAERNIDLYGLREDKIVFENIYPRHIGSLTRGAVQLEAGKILWTVVDTEVNFDLKEQFLEDPKIVFTSGTCAGLKFVIIDYDHATKTITFKEHADESVTPVYVTPNANRKPEVGDAYHYINILMPDSYVIDAKAELKVATVAELAKVSVPVAPYTIEIDPRFVKAEGSKPINGDLVRITNDEIGLDALIRVIGYTYPVINPNEIEVTVCDNILISGSASLLREVRKEITSSLDGSKYHPLTGSKFLPLKAGELQVDEIKSYDYTGTGFEKSGFAVTQHPDYPNENIAIFDHLNVRKTLNIYELIANQIKYMGGKMIFSATAMTILKVIDGGSYWKLFFDTKEGKIKNLWSVGDMVLCQEFDAQNIEIKYYRLKVTTASLEDDFIHVAKGAGSIPENSDFIVQHGHVSDKQRQNILIIDTIGGSRFTSLQGLTETNSKGSVVSEMGWIDGRPIFFVGDKTSSYISFDAATKLLEVVANNVIFKAPSGENTTLEEYAKSTDKEIEDAYKYVDTLPVRTHNLINGSKLNSPWTGYGSRYNMAIWNNQGNYIQAGKTYTLVTELYVDEEFAAVQGESGVIFFINGMIPIYPFFKPTTPTVVSTTFVAETDGYIDAYHYPFGAAGISHINWVKLVEGNKTTMDWQPSIEETKIEIGGVNLLPDSDFSRSLWGIVNGGVNSRIIDPTGYWGANKYVHKLVSTGWANGMYTSLPMITKGQLYSYWVYVDEETPKNITVEGLPPLNSIIIIPPKKWTRVQIVADRTVATNRYAAEAGIFYFTNLQIENGTKFTNWSPAPEDGKQAANSLAMAIAGVDSATLSNNIAAIAPNAPLKWDAVNGLTIGKLFANSIAVDKQFANYLVARNATIGTEPNSRIVLGSGTSNNLGEVAMRVYDNKNKERVMITPNRVNTIREIGSEGGTGFFPLNSYSASDTGVYTLMNKIEVTRDNTQMRLEGSVYIQADINVFITFAITYNGKTIVSGSADSSNGEVDSRVINLNEYFTAEKTTEGLLLLEVQRSVLGEGGFTNSVVSFSNGILYWASFNPIDKVQIGQNGIMNAFSANAYVAQYKDENDNVVIELKNGTGGIRLPLNVAPQICVDDVWRFINYT